MKDGNTAATAISSVAGDESDDVNDQLNIEEFSEDSISDTPKLKDFLPFMNKQQKLKPDRSLSKTNFLHFSLQFSYSIFKTRFDKSLEKV